MAAWAPQNPKPDGIFPVSFCPISKTAFALPLCSVNPSPWGLHCMGYLVISLKIGERIRVGDTHIMISDIDGKRVHVAIDAPKTTPILRTKLELKESGLKNGDQRKSVGRP